MSDDTANARHIGDATPPQVPAQAVPLSPRTAGSFERRSNPIPTPLRVTSEVCARLLIIAAALALLLFLIVQLRIVVIPVAIAVLLSGLLAPVVHWLTTRRVPRGPATALVVVGGLALIAGLLSFVVNTFITEVGAGIALALFALIFFLYDGPRIWKFLLRVAPRTRRERVDVAGRRAFATLVGYTRATVLVAFVDAIGIGIGLWAVGVPLVVPLAALVFLGAFIPTVGAVVTGVVAVLIALVANGLIPAVIVLAVVIAVQQLEGHVLQPLLLGRAVKLHPLAVVLSVAAGVVVAGIPGALLAVPLLAILSAAVRSMNAPAEADPATVNAVDPHEGDVHNAGVPHGPSWALRLWGRITGRPLKGEREAAAAERADEADERAEQAERQADG
jgi:predicted PurR-regulated permease PerM